MLRGRHLSPVQTKALVILNFLDEIAREEQRAHDVKLAMVAGGHPKPWLVLPDYIAAPEGEQAAPDPAAKSEGAAWDYSGVTWGGPDAMAEYEQLMRQIGQATGGKISGDALVANGARNGARWTEWK